MQGATLKADDPRFEELLSRYFDGELSPQEALEVESVLQSEPAAQEQLEQLGALQQALRSSYRAELDSVDFGQFWTNVEAGIEATKHERASSPASVPSEGVWSRLQNWWSGLSWGPLGLGIGVTAAAALAMLLVPSAPKAVPVPVADKLNPPVMEPGQAAEKAAVEVAALPPGLDTAEMKFDGVEVTSVSGGSASTVMVMQSPEQATIIWVHEEGGTSI